MKNIVILISGNGSNAINILNYFKSHGFISVVSVFSSNPNSKFVYASKEDKIPVFVFNRFSMYQSTSFLSLIDSFSPSLIVLAGFLWKIPSSILEKYDRRIINIHPSLLPKYGGKGMYGGKVHEAVLKNRESHSGITIHYVNEYYDEGDIIFQAKTVLDVDENIESLTYKIHQLEYEHFPKTIERILSC